jgi:hypothetical protein
VNSSLNKQAQLMIVVVGFFATVQLLIFQTSDGAAPLARDAIALALALGCAVRYWWVILLLPWPARWFRMVLLLLAWTALPAVAITTGNPARWALAIAALSAIGCITEIYNGITKQWLVGSEEMARSLKRDHIAGAASAGAATVLLVLVAVLRPVWVDFAVPLMVLADWARLIAMIRRHQRFIDLGYST